MDQYVCRACGQRFESREELERHNRDVHPGSMAGSPGRTGTQRMGGQMGDQGEEEIHPGR